MVTATQIVIYRHVCCQFFLVCEEQVKYSHNPVGSDDICTRIFIEQ